MMDGTGPRHDESEAGRDPTLVSVVMVNLNCGRFFDVVFPTLREQTYRQVEVIVVDNGSTDGSIQRLPSAYPDLRVITLGQNRGFSHATNVGIRAARGEFVLALNFDVALEPTFIERLVEAIRGDPRVGWAAGCMVKMARNGRREIGALEADDIDCCGHHMMRTRYAFSWDLSKPFVSSDYLVPSDVFGASACAALYRREMLDDIAIDGECFDEDFFAYFEDVDVDWRAQHRGWRCRYTPHAVGYHVRGGTGLIRKPEIAACELSNRILMMVKNDSPSLLLRDWYPVLHRTAREFVRHALWSRRAVLMALRRVVTYTPRMLRKRRAIMARSVVATEHFGDWIR